MKGQQPNADSEENGVEHTVDNHVRDLGVSINLHRNTSGRFENGGLAEP